MNNPLSLRDERSSRRALITIRSRRSPGPTPRVLDRSRPRPLALGCLLLSALLGACSGGVADEPHKVVVLVTLDTLRPDHLSCYGYARETSPFLDRMADEGVRFAHAIAACSHTAPAHASIFTSLLPLHHRVLENGQRLRAEFDPMAKLLKNAGYDTAAFTSVEFLQGLDAGFDLFVPGDYSDNARAVLDRVRAYVTERQLGPTNERPLFLWIHLYEPHQPYLARETAYYKQLDSRTEAEKEAFMEYIRSTHPIPPNFFRNRPQASSWLIDNYDAEIRFADQELESFYGFMEESGLSQDALWIFVSDHGEGLGDHGLHGHDKHLYQEQLRIALIVHETNRKQSTGKTAEQLVRHVDILPTVIEWAGLNTPEHHFREWQGMSLMPILSGAQDTLPIDFAYSQRRSSQGAPNWLQESVFAIQTTRYKYILHTRSDDELYDLEQDPLELDNIFEEGSETSHALRQELRRVTEGWKGELLEPILDADGHVDELTALGYMGSGDEEEEE